MHAPNLDPYSQMPTRDTWFRVSLVSVVCLREGKVDADSFPQPTPRTSEPFLSVKTPVYSLQGRVTGKHSEKHN